MENINISRINSSRINHEVLYKEISPLQENLLNQEEPIYYNCGINTVSNESSKSDINIENHFNLIEEQIIIEPKAELDKKINQLIKKEKHINKLLNVYTITKQVINVIGNVSAVFVGTSEVYSIVLQNIKSAPSLDIIEFGISCSIISGALICTIAGKYLFNHYQKQLANQSNILSENIIKLEIKKNNM